MSKLKNILIGDSYFTQYYPKTHIVLAKNREEFGSISFTADTFKCRPYNESDAKIFGDSIENGVEFEGSWSIETDNILSLQYNSCNWKGKFIIYEDTIYLLIKIIKDSENET